MAPPPILRRLRPYLRPIEVISWGGWASFTAYALFGPLPPDQRPGLFAYNLVVGLYNYVLFHYLIARYSHKPAFYFIQVTYAVGIVTASIWLIAGLRSTLDSILALLVVGAAIVGGLPLGLYATALAALSAWLVSGVGQAEALSLVLPAIVRAGMLGALAVLVQVAMRLVAEHGERAARQTVRQLERLNVLQQMSVAVGSSLDLRVVTDMALTRAAEALRLEAGVITMLDADAQTITLYAHTGLTADLAAQAARLPLQKGEGLVGAIIANGRPISTDNLARDPRVQLTLFPQAGYQSFIGIPLKSGGQTLGALVLLSRASLRPDDTDMEFLGAIGEQLGLAIDNAQAYENTRRGLAETEALYAFAQRERENSGAAEIAEAALAAARAVMPIDNAIVHLSDGEPLQLTPLCAFVNGRVLGARDARAYVADVLGAPEIGGVTGWVLANRQAQRVGDVRHDPRFVGNTAMRSELCVPIMRQAHVLGVFNAECAALDAYDARHERFMQTLAGQLAVAIEGARLAEAERQRALELEAQYEISQTFSVLGSTHDTYAEITRRLAQVFGAQGAVVTLYDPVRRVMRAQAPAYGVSPEPLRDVHFRLTGVARRTWDPQRAPYWIVNDARTAAPYVQRLAARFQSRQWLAAAMFGHSGLVGALYVFNRAQPEPFTTRDGRLLSVLARQAALAIENARLIETERNRRRELSLINEIDRQAGATLDRAQLMHGLVQRIREAWGYPGVAIFILEGDELVTGARDAVMDGPADYRQSIHQGTLGWVARNRRARLVNDVARESDFVDPAGVGMRSELIVPLLARDELMGVLALASGQPNQFEAADLELMQTIAGQIAQALVNARLYESERRRATQIATVSALGQEITSMLNLTDLLDRSVQLVRTRFGFARVRLFLADFDKNIAWVAAVAGQDTAPASSTLPLRSAAAAARAISEQQPGRDAASAASGEVLAVPVRSAERTLGALEVQARPAGSFNADDEAVIQTLADQLAVAIANAELHMAVERQARTDSLTGVYNHNYFLESLREAVNAARERNAPLTLIMLDIDYFKRYNDTYGHVTGDRVLVTMVQAIRRNVKQGDMVGRWGGEEFCVGLPGATATQAMLVAERIRVTLVNMPLKDARGRDIPKPTVSQGLAVYPDHAQTPEALIDLADRMLYEAKGGGRDQVILYAPEKFGAPVRAPEESSQ